MKNAVLILVVLASLEKGFGDTNCMLKDLEKIRTCYHDLYGKDLSAPTGPYLLTEPIFSENVTKEFWQPFCDKKQNLNDCIGTNVTENCYNIIDIKEIPHGNGYYTDELAKFVIASFIQIDYVCDKLFKLSEDDYNCYIDNIQNIAENCSNNATSESCEAFNTTVSCVVETIYKKCGKIVGCFERKDSLLDLCYADTNCHTCDGISFTNSLIDGLCDNNDESFVEKTADENTSIFNFI